MIIRIFNACLLLISASAFALDTDDRLTVTQLIEPNFSGVAYNRQYREYWPMPTFGAVFFSDCGRKANALKIKVKQYPPKRWSYFYVESEKVEEHIKAVKVYLSRPVLTSTTIDIAKIVSSLLDEATVYSIFDAVDSGRLLIIDPLGDHHFDDMRFSVYLDRAAAKNYLKLLEEFEAGAFVAGC